MDIAKSQATRRSLIKIVIHNLSTGPGYFPGSRYQFVINEYCDTPRVDLLLSGVATIVSTIKIR